MKIRLLLSTLLLLSISSFADSYYVSSRGWGRSSISSNDYFACQDAKRDADWKLRNRCRGYGSDFSLEHIRYSPYNCWCREQHFGGFTCDVDAYTYCSNE